MLLKSSVSETLATLQQSMDMDYETEMDRARVVVQFWVERTFVEKGPNGTTIPMNEAEIRAEAHEGNLICDAVHGIAQGDTGALEWFVNEIECRLYTHPGDSDPDRWILLHLVHSLLRCCYENSV